MKYISSRGEAPILGFCEAMLAGLARDGGLYLPETWPQMTPAEIRGIAGLPFHEAALRVLSPFVGDEIEAATFAGLLADAYAGFRHAAVAPLVQTGPNSFILELFHGPTLAFKDIAMQLLGRIMDHVLSQRGRRATIVGATSGDTGSAAIEAFRGRANVDIFILYPHGRVSPVQQRQMTTVADANVHALAVEGTFDDCQALVKAMFNDHGFRDRLMLSGVNSINWARIMAQIVYYFAAAANLGAPERQVSFCVPTGNFGDIFAGYAAKRMGLPVDRLIIATNENDILARTIATGRYETHKVTATTSPSMDIQVSSNFERLLFEASGRDPGQVRRLMDGLTQSGAFTLPAAMHAEIRKDFDAGKASQAEVASTIRALREGNGYLADPHTAVGLHVAGHFALKSPTVTLATAHPAKFPAAVKAASGEEPQLPQWLGNLMQRPERFEVVANDLGAVEALIEGKTGAREG
jgi:threonine synthase